MRIKQVMLMHKTIRIWIMSNCTRLPVTCYIMIKQIVVTATTRDNREEVLYYLEITQNKRNRNSPAMIHVPSPITLLSMQPEQEGTSGLEW